MKAQFLPAIYFAVPLLILCSCKGNGNFETSLPTQENPYGKLGKDSSKTVILPQTQAARGPIINITDSTFGSYTLLTIKDTALNDELLIPKLDRLLGTMLYPTLAKLNVQQQGWPFAWFEKMHPPYSFEIGIPILSAPAKMPKGFNLKKVNYNNIVIAHFYGPKSLLNVGYGAVNSYIDDNKLDPDGDPFMIFYPAPVPADKKQVLTEYDQRTDLIFPVKERSNSQ